MDQQQPPTKSHNPKAEFELYSNVTMLNTNNSLWLLSRRGKPETATTTPQEAPSSRVIQVQAANVEGNKGT